MPTTSAAVTIEFSKPIKGSDLIAAVKTVAEQNKARLYSQHQFDDGDIYLIGQASGYPYDHVLVAPSKDETTVRLDQSYGRVVAMSHRWPMSVYAIGYGEDAVLISVRKFADALKHQVDYPGVDARPSVWPQEVTVCAICESIVTRSLDNTLCPKDGHNPPTRRIKVLPQ